MNPSMHLLPPAVGKCPVCAGDHPPDFPHNAQSLYYQYRFMGLRGRWPTWADAMAHCTEETQNEWTTQLLEMEAYSAPTEGVEPIADPPEESVNQLVDMQTFQKDQES